MDRLKITPGVLSAPTYACFELTDRCNAKCKHCYVNTGGKVGLQGSEPLSTKQVFQALDHLAAGKLFTVAFGGGEPLLRKDIFDIIAYTKSLGLQSCMATNGALLNKENVDKLAKAGIHALQMSLDGATSDSHDEFRRFPGLFNRIVEACRYLRDTNIIFFTSTVLYKGNLSEIEDIVALAYGLGCKMSRMITLIPVGTAKRELLDMDPTYDEFVDMFERTSKLQEKFHDDDFAVHFMLPFGMPGRCITALRQAMPSGEHSKLASYMTGCDCARTRIGICSDGSVFPCESIKDKRFYGGNIVNSTMEEIWRSPGFEAFREAASQVPSKCKECDFLKFCGGGCRAVALNLTGQVDVDPRCEFRTWK